MKGDTHDQLTAAEALWGFTGWLISREERTVMSNRDDFAPVAELVAEFCVANNLDAPQGEWKGNVMIKEDERGSNEG